MKIIVTGGAGFVGANLCKYFAAKGHEVIAVDNLVRRGSEMNLPDFKRLGIRFVHGDIRNREDLVPLPRDVDFVCECSAQPSATEGYKNPAFDISNNTLGVLNCLEWCRETGAGLIFWSTNKCYCGDRMNANPMREEATRWVWDAEACRARGPVQGFDPVHGYSNDFSVDGGDHSIYGVSKICADLLCQEWAGGFGVRTVVNRFSCLAGEGQFGKSEQGWVAWWAVAAIFDLPLLYIGWNGKQVRDVLFIEDICRLVEAEMNQIDRAKGQVFNCGGGPKFTLSLREATSWVERATKKTLKTRVDPAPRKADQCIYISDIRKAKEVLGWEPKVSIDEGYERILRWVVDHKDALRQLYL